MPFQRGGTFLAAVAAVQQSVCVCVVVGWYENVTVVCILCDEGICFYSVKCFLSVVIF